MKPYNIQKEFLGTILDNSKHTDNPNIQIYQELVLFRFLEVIKSTYPIYTSSISKDNLDGIVKQFIKNGCKTPFVWKISMEFKEFVYNLKSTTKLQKETLIFELKQILIYVSNRAMKSRKISYTKSYRLSKNALVMKLNSEYILIYKNKYDNMVYHLSISKFLYYFFKYQRGNNTINKAIKFASKRSSINYNDAIKISNSTIVDFVYNGILI